MKFLTRLPANMARLSLAALLVGLMAVILAACGGSEATPAPTAPAGGAATATTASGGGAAAAEVQAVLNEWSVTLNVDQVKAGKVKFIVNNPGNFTHDLVVKDSADAEIGRTPAFGKAEAPKELVVDLKPGTYTLVCDIPGHTDKGMKTQLVVK